MRTTDTKTTPPAASALLVLSLSVAACMLALFQWMELLLVRAGGTAVCSINETMSCQKVWDSAFAARIHSWTGVPVAGWGLVWGLGCLTLSLAWIGFRLNGQSGAVAVAGLKWNAWAGLFASLTFGVASFRAGAVCLTCLGTYTLAVVFAVVVFTRLPGPPIPEGSDGRSGLLASFGLVVVGFLVVLFPGLRTPHAEAGGLPFLSPNRPATPALSEFVARLSPEEKQFLSDAIADYRRQTPVVSHHPIRMQEGPSTAVLRLVEFTDILCPHCRHFGEALAQLKSSLPPDTFSVEPRQYPLDSQCNPNVQRSDGRGIRCLAAKALICLEGTADYARINHELFEEQEQLTPERVTEIASSGPMKRPALEQCIAQPETQIKLLQDVAYAQELHVQGTPLVAINGRPVMAAPLFLYALALAKGSPDELAALSLPPPRPPRPLP